MPALSEWGEDWMTGQCNETQSRPTIESVREELGGMLFSLCFQITAMEVDGKATDMKRAVVYNLLAFGINAKLMDAAHADKYLRAMKGDLPLVVAVENGNDDRWCTE